MNDSNAPIVVVGAGVAGLRCAALIKQAGLPVVVLEAEYEVGGCLRTKVIDGHILDRGFQVLQTAYPEAQAALDYSRLELVTLEPGASVRLNKAWYPMVDPWRRPAKAWSTIFNPSGGISDRLALWRLLRSVRSQDGESLLAAPNDQSTRQYLSEFGFSTSFIEHFLRPWLSGIFLEADLATSSNYFRFVLKMLSAGDIAYPRSGIAAIPKQLSEPLGQGEIRLASKAIAWRNHCIHIEGQEPIAARALVLACSPAIANKILEHSPPNSPSEAIPRFNPTRCIYFAADTPPTDDLRLMLNGDKEGPINHVFIPTNSFKSQNGQATICVNLVGTKALEENLDESIMQQLEDWFGEQVQNWHLLADTCLPQALPFQPPGFYAEAANKNLPSDVYQCGQSQESTSLQGALRSGRLTAEFVIQQFDG